MGSILIGLSFLISKILGLIRDNLLAASFGAGQGSGIFNLDTYYAAFRLPDLVFNLFSLGILSTAFMPIFVELYKRKSRSEAFRFAYEATLTIGIVISGISLVLFFAAPYVLKLFVPGFTQDALDITVRATRIMLLTPLLFTIANSASAIGNSLHRYVGIALGPIMYNLGIIVGVLVFAPRWGVYGVSMGVVAGALLNMLVLLPHLLGYGIHYTTGIRLWSSHIKEMITLSIPRIFGMSVSQVVAVIDTILASTLATGSITVINLAVNIEHIPIGMVGVSVAIVSFSTLSSHVADGKREDFVHELRHSLHKVLFLLIPMSAGLFLLRVPVVRLLLGRGKFSESDVFMTADTLGVLATGIACAGIVYTLSRGFYALKNTRTPVALSIIAMFIAVAGSFISTKVLLMGTIGLAASHVASNIVYAISLLAFLQAKVQGTLLEWREILIYLVATLCMSAAISLMKTAMHVLFVAFIGAVVYFVVCSVCGSKEIFRLKTVYKNFIKKT